MTSDVMSQVRADHPLMKAWTAYQDTDGFKNSLMWATATTYSQAGKDVLLEANQISSVQREQHAKGSLWAAFVAGFNAATERAVALHESVNPASDAERLHDDPGAGAMGAVIQYRDMIRVQQP